MLLKSSKLKLAVKRRINWQRQVVKPLVVIIWVSLAFILASLLTGPLLSLLGSWSISHTVNKTTEIFLSGVLLYGLTLIFLLFIPRLLAKHFQQVRPLVISVKDLGIDGWLTWQQLLLGVLGFIAVMILMFVVTSVLVVIAPGLDINQVQDLGFEVSTFYQRRELIMIFITLVVLAPIVEELMFRGYLYAKLRTVWPAWLVVVVVSCLFGLAHGQLNTAILTGLMSIVMCITREWSETVYPGIIIHILKNGLAFYSLFVLGIR